MATSVPTSTTPAPHTPDPTQAHPQVPPLLTEAIAAIVATGRRDMELMDLADTLDVFPNQLVRWLRLLGAYPRRTGLRRFSRPRVTDTALMAAADRIRTGQQTVPLAIARWTPLTEPRPLLRRTSPDDDQGTPYITSEMRRDLSSWTAKIMPEAADAQQLLHATRVALEWLEQASTAGDLYARLHALGEQQVNETYLDKHGDPALYVARAEQLYRFHRHGTLPQTAPNTSDAHRDLETGEFTAASGYRHGRLLWHAANTSAPSISGPRSTVRTLCGENHLPSDRLFDRADPALGELCPQCAWQVAAHTNQLGTELKAWQTTGRDAAALQRILGPAATLHTRLCERIIALDLDLARWPDSTAQTLLRLATVTSHRPMLLPPEECAQNDCQHRPTDLPPSADWSCAYPDAIAACVDCSPAAGGWAGEWEGDIDLAVPTPCSVLLTLAAVYNVEPDLDTEHDAAEGRGRKLSEQDIQRGFGIYFPSAEGHGPAFRDYPTC